MLFAAVAGYYVLKGDDTATAPATDQSQTTTPAELAAAEPAASPSSVAAPVESAPTEAATCLQYTWNGESWTCTGSVATGGAN